MSVRSLLLPGLALATLMACTPAPGATSGASTAPTASGSKAPGAAASTAPASTGPATSTAPASTSPVTSPATATSPSPAASKSAYSAVLLVDGKAKSINPNTESPLFAFGGLGVQWGFGINQKGGPADQVAIVLQLAFKKSSAPKLDEVTAIKLSIVPGDGSTPFTLLGEPGAGFVVTGSGTSMDVHLKGKAASSEVMIQFDATGVRFG